MLSKVIKSRRKSPPVEPPSPPSATGGPDRKSTRLNSSHSQISYAVFCLKKKKQQKTIAGLAAAPAHPTPLSHCISPAEQGPAQLKRATQLGPAFAGRDRHRDRD